jgi:adenine-specific DNA-methyltransferase
MLESRQARGLAVSARAYLDTIPLGERRLAGLVYTPEHLVDFTFAQVGYQPRAAIEDAVLLDPSCGAGAFLGRALTVLASRLERLGVDLQSPAGHRKLIEATEANLFGIDVDPHACELARSAITQRLLELSPGRVSKDFFKANLLVADFLIDREVDKYDPILGRKLQFVVGNPPYVSATRISSSSKVQLRARFHSAGGRLDLYTVFIERALSLLGAGGRLALVTPDKFLVSQSARGLRAFVLQSSAVRSIAQFRSHRVFEDAATVPCVTVFERGGRPRDVTVLTCAEKPTERGRVRVLSHGSVPHPASATAWHVFSPELHELARRLQGRHPTLAQLTVRVSAGPATGRDGLYVFHPGQQPDIEQELLRSVVRGRDVHAYRVEDAGLKMLVPYVFDATGTSRLIDIDAFPGARKYLEQHRRELESRHCVRVWGKRWYDLHDQVLSDLTRQTKLLVPDVANSNRFAVDHGQFLPLHSVYYLLPRPGIDPDFLAAVLNSSVTHFLIRLFAPVVKSGFNRYRQQFLLTLPVPIASTEQIKELALAAQREDSERADELVRRLFGLRDQDARSLNVEGRAGSEP